MKKSILILIVLTSFCIDAAEKKMDFKKEKELYDFSTQTIPTTNYTNQSTESMIKTINNELNTHIPQGILFQKSPRELTAQEYQSLVERVERICPSITDPSIIKLVQKNSYFHASLQHFFDIARKNLEQVTCATLDIVRDSRNQQPTPELNTLFPTLKKYVMDNTYSEMKYEHSIKFNGHTHPVCCIDINNPYAASSCTQGIAKIWNILTGKERYTLTTNNKYSWMKFNQDSSLLATVLMTHKSHTSTVIDIWKIDPVVSPKNPYYSIDHSHSRDLSKICFLGNNICIFETYGMTQYKLKKDGSVIKLGQINSKNIGYNENLPYPIARDNTNNSWSLVKNSGLLYLCKQAVINTKLADSIPSIIRTTTYQELWPHEQDKVQKLAQKKRGIEIS